MASESDDSDLRERVEQLEATVEQQQQTIRKMLPGRRGALKAGGLLAGGGLLGALGSERVAAADGTQDTSAGTIGAAGDSTDIYLDQLYDPDGDEILNVDDTGDINAAFGRTWDFDSVDLQNSSLTLDSLTTEQLSFTSGQFKRLDDNSPWEISVKSSDTFNLDDSYTAVKLEVIDSGAGTDVDLQANGATSGYNWVKYDGTTDSGSAWEVVMNSGFALGNEIIITSGTDNQAGINNRSIEGFDSRVNTGRCGNISNDISSLTAKANDGSSSFDVTFRVWVME